MNWEQFRAILWLRWRLTWNQTLRGSKAGAALGVLAIVMLVLIALTILVGGLMAGKLIMAHITPMEVMFAWDGIGIFLLFLWVVGVLAELQRSESISLERLLHLPIGLKQVFVFNYLISLVAFTPIIGFSAMLGLGIGLTMARGPMLALLIPLAVGFIFMVTAWIYCLRGWLLSLMISKRRKRSIVMWVTIIIVLLGQLPQLIPVLVQRRVKEHLQKHPAGNAPGGANKDFDKELYLTYAKRLNTWVPVLWLGNGARGLAEGNVLPALWGGAGMFVLGWIGMSRSYRSTLKFYRGDEKVKVSEVKHEKKAESKPRDAAASRNWVEWRLPWLPEDTAGLAAAHIRSLSRAPEVRMMLTMGLFMSIFLPFIIFFRGGIGMPTTSNPFIVTSAMVFVLFMTLQLVCNQFGCDRDGFRGLVLLPTPRKRILLGKNLAMLPFVGGIALLPLAVATYMAKLSVGMVLGAMVQFAGAFLLFCTVGNMASILAPYRIAQGSLKPTKQSWQTALIALLLQFTFPIIVSPIFLPPLLAWASGKFDWAPVALVYLLSALAVTGVVSLVYVLTLEPLGRLLQRRETKILRAVTEVVD